MHPLLKLDIRIHPLLLPFASLSIRHPILLSNLKSRSSLDDDYAIEIHRLHVDLIVPAVHVLFLALQRSIPHSATLSCFFGAFALFSLPCTERLRIGFGAWIIFVTRTEFLEAVA